MVLAAFSLSTAATVATAVVGCLVFLAALYALSRYFANLNSKSELEAKDDIIATNQQAIDSFRARVEALEEDLARVTAMARQAQEEVVSLQVQLTNLRQYAAPDAVKAFEAASKHRYETILDYLKRIDRKLNPSTNES